MRSTITRYRELKRSAVPPIFATSASMPGTLLQRSMKAFGKDSSHPQRIPIRSMSRFRARSTRGARARDGATIRRRRAHEQTHMLGGVTEHEPCFTPLDIMKQYCTPLVLLRSNATV